MSHAFLVDVYETLVSCDFTTRRLAVAERTGADPDLFQRGLLARSPDLDRGVLSLDDALAAAIVAAGGVPRAGMLEEFSRVYSEDARLFPDAIPFLTGLRERGIPVALVSNCTTYTRPMLEALGVLELVDAAVLSCEIGCAKPSPEIYQVALDRLGVPASGAVFVDDQSRYCDGAVAAGVRAVQILRDGAAASDGIPVIRSLLELMTGR